jgi:hypothetical protein
VSTIRGSVFQDLNGNAIFDLGEGLPNVTVFLDDNGDGLPTDLEQVRLTDFNGEYTFAGLPAGTFVLDQVTPPGFNEPLGVPISLATTGDVNERIDVNILNVNPVPPVNPVPTTTTLSGAVYVDNNRNGIYEPFGELGEPTLAEGFPNAAIYIDLNNSGFFELSEPSAVPNEAGFYIFEGLPPGSYLLRAELPSGFELIDDDSSIDDNSIVANVNFGINALDIGVINPNSVYGRVIRDLNGDGIPNPNEPPQDNIDVTIVNRNTDDIETATTDNNGFYIIDGLDTAIDGEDDPQNPFANYIARTEPERFANAFEIEFGTPSSAYVFTSPVPPVGAFPGEIGLTLVQGESLQVNATLVLNPAGSSILLPNSIGGVVFNDRNANSLLDFDPVTGLADDLVTDATLFIDLDDDGVRGDNEPTTTTDFNGNFAFTNLLPTPNIDPITGLAAIEDTYVVRVEPTDDLENLTTPIAAITLGAGEAVQLTFGLSGAVPFPPENQFAQVGGGIDPDALIPVRGFTPTVAATFPVV